MHCRPAANLAAAAPGARKWSWKGAEQTEMQLHLLLVVLVVGLAESWLVLQLRPDLLRPDLLLGVCRQLAKGATSRLAGCVPLQSLQAQQNCHVTSHSLFARPQMADACAA